MGRETGARVERSLGWKRGKLVSVSKRTVGSFLTSNYSAISRDGYEFFNEDVRASPPLRVERGARHERMRG